MFKLVVLCAVLAVASAKPSLIHSAVVAPAVQAYYAGPSAVSHQSRVDVNSSPLVYSAAAPVVQAYAAPAVQTYAAPAIQTYAAPAVVAAPAAVSHQSRVDVVSSQYAAAPVVSAYAAAPAIQTIEVAAAPAIQTYAAPAVQTYAAPAIQTYAAPAIQTYAAPAVVAAPAAVSHQSRVDVVSSQYAAAPVVSAYAAAPVVSSYAAPIVSSYASAPVVSSYAAPVVSSYASAPFVSYGEPALYPGSPAGVVKATGKLVDTADVVVARNNHLVAKALNAHGIHKRSVYAPLAYSAVVAPSAISHQSRVDYHSSPLVAAYSTPVVSAYSAPIVSAYSSPILSAYSSPVVSTYAAAPVVSYGEPALYPGSPAGVVKANGKLVDTADVVVARNNHLVAKALNAHGIHKRSIVTPLAYSAVVGPSSVSHQSRVDYHSSPVVAAYSTPVVSAYSHAPVVSSYAHAPVVSAYSSPLLSAYSSPVVSAYSAPLLSHNVVAPIKAYSVHPW